MHKYPPLPMPPSAEVGEPLHRYGIRLLMFVVDVNITATMSEEELTLASYVVPIAVSNRGKDGTDLKVVENIRKAADLISLTLRGRLKLAEEEARATGPTVDTSREGGLPSLLRPPVHINPLPPSVTKTPNWGEIQKEFDKHIHRFTREGEIPVEKPGDNIRF